MFAERWLQITASKENKMAAIGKVTSVLIKMRDNVIACLREGYQYHVDHPNSWPFEIFML